MKKRKISVFKFLSTLTIFCTIFFCVIACDKGPVVEDYLINEKGNLVAVYDDGSTVELGDLEDTIANGVVEVEVDKDGYYIINGIKTDIKTKLPTDYSIDSNGNLIITYDDGTTENLGSFNEDAVESIDTITISEDGYYVINGIKTDIVAVSVYKVDFNTGFSTKVPSQNIKDGYKVERPEIERKGYTLNGWFCNGEEWLFNSHVVKNDMILDVEWTANQYTVSFSTGISEVLEDIVVTYDSTYELPVLSQTGYKFLGWEYNGSLVTSEKWNIADNCTLVAKWDANEYVITLDANGGSVAQETVTVEYDKDFVLPVPKNEFGVFLGWFYGDVKITDEKGKSLEKWTYTNDIEVSTSWIIDVKTADDLKLIETYPNGCFELKNDIDISLIEWEPLCSKEKPFVGSIDGGNHNINGLKITQLYSNSAYYGFIGYSAGGIISNINFNNVNISLPIVQNTVYCGSVIGYNTGTILKNIKVSGSLKLENHSSTFESHFGGLVGFSSIDKISECSNSANITSKTHAGGIVGILDVEMKENNFIFNKNYGNISNAIYSGGIIAESKSICITTNLHNFGDIIGIEYSGGIVGITAGFLIEKCSNEGNISTTSSQTNVAYLGCGGIVGSATIVSYLNSIKNSYNQGNIVGNNDVGGIVGSSFYVYVMNTYNSGNITAGRIAAGIAGGNTQYQIYQSANYGTIDGLMSATYVYTIGQTTARIIDCFYNCPTSGISQVQGTKTTDKFSKEFYTGSMFWSEDVWNFYDDSLPTLK